MPIPKPTEFFLSVPLYAPVAYESEQVWDVLDVLYFDGTYDSFCIKCNRESTFKVTSPKRTNEFVRDLEHEKLMRAHGIAINHPRLSPSIYAVTAKCTRDASHRQDFLFFVDCRVIPDGSGPPTVEWSFQKIGQQPSYGDLHLLQVKKYTHVLSGSQLKELTRAIGLASHDVGVGAYVYLRRIFENLVEEAHARAKEEAAWDEDSYACSRMSEKIAQLKAFLPSFLVEHPGMYSLLSKGIHELSEEECLKHFSTLRIGIELILDERLQARERANKIAAAKVAIQKAVGEAGA